MTDHDRIEHLEKLVVRLVGALLRHDPSPTDGVFKREVGEILVDLTQRTNLPVKGLDRTVEDRSPPAQDIDPVKAADRLMLGLHP